MLVLFHDRKCCNCINFFPCILWDFIVLNLVLSWWRIKHEMKISVISWLAYKRFAKKVLAKRAREKHMLEAEKSRSKLYFASTSWDRPSCKVPAKFFTWRFLSVTFIPFTNTIYTLITHKSKKRLYSERNPKIGFYNTTHPPFGERATHSLVRNHYNLFSFPLPLAYLERRFVPKHNPHIFRV